MPENEKRHKEKIWVLKSWDGKVVFRGTHEECQAVWQLRHEQRRREFHDRIAEWQRVIKERQRQILDHDAERQRRWQQRGGKDEDRGWF